MAVSVFIAYSHRDDQLRREIETHFAAMKRAGIISIWHDQLISPGTEWRNAISDHLETADVILLLVSADFFESSFCYEVEMTRAIERHERREARVIPIIARPCDWHSSPIGKLQALPRDGKPLTTAPNLDEAILEVVTGIRGVEREMSAERQATAQTSATPTRHVHAAAYQFRSANLTMLPGDIGTFSTFYANVGTTTWLRNTETETGLLFLNREQRMRRWAHQWASEFVLARQTKDAVAPGDFTAYTFNCRVPDDVDVPSTEMFMCQPIVLAVVPLLIGQPEPFFVYVRAANDGRRRA